MSLAAGGADRAPARAGIAVCVPTYNERENLPPLLERLLALPLDLRVLVLDDSSPDGTGALAEEWAGRDGRVRHLPGPAKGGLGAAYRRGFAALLVPGGPEWIAMMDADLSHDPAALPGLLACARRRAADLVIGSRYVAGGSTSGWPLSRRLLSRSANRFVGALLGGGVRDFTSGFRCLRASTLAALRPERLRAEGYGFMIELTWRMLEQGRRVAEQPIAFVDRRLGASKLSGAIAVESLALALRLWLGRLAGGPRGAKRP